MSAEINVRLQICRTCLKMSESLYNIFEKDNGPMISEMLMDYAGVKVQEDDELPVNICDNCVDKLNSACDFITMAVTSDKKLHNFYEEAQNNDVNQLTFKEEIIERYKKYVLGDDEQETSDDSPTENEQDKNECNQSKMKTDEYSDSIGDKNDSEQVVKEEDVEEDLNSTIDFEESIKTADLNNSNVELVSETVNERTLSNNSNCTDDNVDGETRKEKKKRKTSFSDDNDECDTPIKSLDLAEFERLNKTLSRSEKKHASFHCKLCNKSFGFYYYSQIHLPQHVGKVPHKCEVCGKSFVLASLLRTHMKKHSTSKPYSCEKCGKCFKYAGHLRSHMTCHSDDFPHECSTCGRSFKQKLTLTAHLQTHKSERAFVCDTCGKAFVTQSSLYNHMFTHDEDIRISCSTCGKSYKNKKYLAVHVKKHLDVKQHVCSYCDRRFYWKTVLDRHILIHTGEKPHSCRICGKTFRQKSCILRHMRTHSGETPYACEKCPMQFKYSHHLLKHTKVHN